MLAERLSLYSDSLTRFSATLSQLPVLPVPQVLDLGCGLGYCAWAIQKQWSAVKITGLDRDAEVLRRIPDFVMPVQADLRAMPIRNDPFGLIIIRHPNIAQAPVPWQSALYATLELLCREGILLVSCYSLAERNQIGRWVTEAEAKLTSSMQPIVFRQHLIALPDAVGHDRYVTAWRLVGEGN